MKRVLLKHHLTQSNLQTSPAEAKVATSEFYVWSSVLNHLVLPLVQLSAAGRKCGTRTFGTCGATRGGGMWPAEL